MPEILDWKLPPYTVEQVFVAESQIVDWGVAALGVPLLWKQGAGEGVRVAVLDTGKPDHPDLADAIEDAVDFTGSRNGVRDIQGHSTFCCGIAAARDNQLGTVGVAPKAMLLCGKVLGDNGSGSSQSVAQGILWAISKRVDLISMSLGSAAPDQTIHDAIIAAYNAGISVLCAAGNSGPSQNTVEYPGRWPECLAVASTNQQGLVSSYSSRGPEVDIAAPGEKIASTYLNGTIAILSGTSMSTPLVAGVIALALSYWKRVGLPLPGPRDFPGLLQRCATDIDAPGFDPNAGWGLIDPKKLLDVISLPPVVPIPSPVPGPLPSVNINVSGAGTIIVNGRALT